MFREILPFDKRHVSDVPRTSGVYIIYTRDLKPFYVGRSRRNIRDRLMAHLNGSGSRKIRDMRNQGRTFRFEYQDMASVEQAEAVLIGRLGTSRFGNLRRESDPADWTSAR